MNKLLALIALSLSTVFAHAASTTVSSEYDYNHLINSNTRSHYGAVGVLESTDYGTFDLWVQGTRTTNGKHAVDNMSGFEAGYTYANSAANFNYNVRQAFGTFKNIGPSAGSANYSLTSSELSHTVHDTTSLYVGYSFMFGLNDFAIPASRRYQIGFDNQLTKNISIRTGYSMIRQLNTVQNGAVIITSYTF